MSNIYKEGYDFYFWNYEDQTKMKHFVFQEYFDVWVKILGKYNSLNYFDCFGGCGAYINNDEIYYGSPILAAEKIEANKSTLGRNVNIVIIERDKANIDNIKKVFQHRKIGIKPTIIEGDFDRTINMILDKNSSNLSPTFFLIDPFGFSIKYKTLKRIMSVPKSEIFLNFMFTRVNQFLADSSIEHIINDLFGCDSWHQYTQYSGQQREDCIVNLFRNQLKKFAQYVCYYRMSFADKNRTYYYLFHLTNHHLGCSIMKSSFAKFNHSKVEYLGPRYGEMSLLDLPEFRVEEVKSLLCDKYRDKTIKYETIIKENIDNYKYLESEFRNALKAMENNEIKIIRVQEKTDTGRLKKKIDYNDKIVFRSGI